jgi:hypothetical protein
MNDQKILALLPIILRTWHGVSDLEVISFRGNRFVLLDMHNDFALELEILSG